MKITEEQRKLLTEWLGECWHKLNKFSYCKVCGELVLRGMDNRTFDNWDDFGVVVEKLDGCRWHDRFVRTLIEINSNKEIPECFCSLVADAIKEGEIK